VDLRLIIGVTATFLAVTLGALALVSLALERRRVSRTLRTLPSTELSADDLRQRTLAIPAVDRLVRPAANRVLAGVRRLTPVAQLERFEEKLVLAGRPVSWDPARLAAVRLIGRVAVPPLVFLALLPTNLGQLQSLLVGLAAGLMMHLAPDVLLDGMIRRRQEEIQVALPDTIDLLTITVEAGLGFDAALDRVGRTSGGPLGVEMRQVVQDIQLGRPRSHALRGMSNRVGLSDVRTLVSSIIQSEQFGITMGTVLRSQADELREKRRQRAEEEAQKVPVKILVPLIFFILPSVFVVIVGPGAIQIAEQF
jgi:tight adherence protein C